jgi:hypothetical protein
MKRLIAAVSFAAATSPAWALFGIGDITFDPTSYAELVKQYEQMVNLYKTAKGQLDNLVSIERTIKEAQQAYETLSSGNLRTLANTMKVDSYDGKSVAGLRSQVASMESSAGNAGSYVSYQMSLINKVESLGNLRKAAASNMTQSTDKVNQATTAAITAQSTSALAALAAAEEQRKVEEDFQRQQGGQAMLNTLTDSTKVYKAIGQ